MMAKAVGNSYSLPPTAVAPLPDSTPERLIKAAFSAISVVTSITYRAEGTRPYERRLYQN